MQYKTLALGLIEARPTLYRKLKSARRLFVAMNGYSRDLRATHLAWTDRLTSDRPGTDRRSLAAAALEYALAELADRLDAADTASGSGDTSDPAPTSPARRPTPAG